MSGTNEQYALLQMMLSGNNNDTVMGPNGPISMQEMLNLLSQEAYQGGSRGASRMAIENLEEREITTKDVQEEKKCGICLEDFNQGQWVKVLPCKKHLFCDLCILEWLKTHNTCPICRTELETLDYDYEQKKWSDKKKKDQDEDNDYPSSMYM